ncbi:hypothetical protein BGZ61DRAFT_468751 [Ilyonectria robusta]|uniref:uncharacterized protein n=1 Tax=Ilyonectria robusta TaxID=1079257 RepID=UPI001E8CDB64|nr:uncharacterized protein BGZ61DRAFT_468751 [Ilyonectria robusta]KAH8651798.1 hypothetical protein BGZ61DRAFT_468751 [Ilyonectria robusta]
MDDPSWAWPAWKFDMKRGDLFTKLHDQYNTYPSPIQDPDAFHHDISEISHEANSATEFHHLANNRRQQRLRELNDAFESASLEIIANPSLISSPQWQHAVQLFRTHSFDSLIRYFASYLPTDHLWHPLCHTTTPVTNNTEPMPHLPDKEYERTRTYDPGGTRWWPSPLSSILPPGLSGTPARDRPVERDESVNTVARAVLFSFSEPARFPPQESSSHVDRGEEMTRPGDDTSTMPNSNTLETAECGNETAYNEGVRPKESLPAKQLAKEVEFRGCHSENQMSRHLHCRRTAQATALTSSATATLASGPSQSTITLANSIRPTNGARAGTKRKRS